MLSYPVNLLDWLMFPPQISCPHETADSFCKISVKNSFKNSSAPWLTISWQFLDRNQLIQHWPKHSFSTTTCHSNRCTICWVRNWANERPTKTPLIEVEKGREIKIKVEKQEFRCLARNFLPDLDFLVWLENYTHLARSVQKNRALVSRA